MRNFKHPFMIKVFDSAESEEDIGFILEYCAQGDLSKFAGRVTEGQVKFIAACLVLVLESFRKKLIYHDWKLENVLMSEDGYP